MTLGNLNMELNGLWFLQIVDREFEHGVKWKVVSLDSRTVEDYIQYILHSLFWLCSVGRGVGGSIQFSFFEKQVSFPVS